jgi:hypothetical protein
MRILGGGYLKKLVRKKSQLLKRKPICAPMFYGNNQAVVSVRFAGSQDW